VVVWVIKIRDSGSGTEAMNSSPRLGGSCSTCSSAKQTRRRSLSPDQVVHDVIAVRAETESCKTPLHASTKNAKTCNKSCNPNPSLPRTVRIIELLSKGGIYFNDKITRRCDQVSVLSLDVVSSCTLLIVFWLCRWNF